MSERRSVLLHAQAQHGEFVEIAKIMDFSPDGMRVITRCELFMDTPFSFFFDKNFLVPNLQGIALPRWQRPCQEAPGFMEVGLVIRDEYSRSCLHSKLKP